MAIDTITLTIPTEWLEGTTPSQDELRQALKLGLAQLREQQIIQETADKVIQALMNTGRVRHLTELEVGKAEPAHDRQIPPTLPGLPVSEILIAQRRGEWL